MRDGDTINVPKAQSVFVSGQVKTPGAYSVEHGTTVLQVLSLAGGVTDRGSTGRVIGRPHGRRRQEERDEGQAATEIVEPGDTIVVKERFF